MGLNSNLTYIWNLCKGFKTRADYIPDNVEDPYNISTTQKNAAKDAIAWLLSKAPHSAEEIADHYAMSPQLVSHLLEELEEVDYVTKESVSSLRYKLKQQDKRVGEAL